MRNIWKIARGDFRRIWSSVVALILVMGLSIVPCLYAWFNIFSNWDPYGPAATSRIRVAVASEDLGQDLFGLEINVGAKMLDALEANDQIGWVFVDSREEALERVCSGDCYAALIVPEKFSYDILSFMELQFEHPKLLYVENGKKNAIAPKITAQAKTSVQQQVNATFLQTLLSSAFEVADVLKANGVDAVTTLENLSTAIDQLSGKLGDCNTTLNSLSTLVTAAESLMYASGALVNDMAVSIGLTVELTENVRSNLEANGGSIQSAVAAVSADLQSVGSSLGLIYSDLALILTDGTLYNDFVENDLLSRVELVRSAQQRAAELAESAENMGLHAMSWLIAEAAVSLGGLADELSALTPVDPEDNEAWAGVQQRLQAAMGRVNTAREAINGAIQAAGEAIGAAVSEAFQAAGDSIASAEELIRSFQGKTAGVAGSLNSLGASLGGLENGLLSTMEAINRGQAELSDMAAFVDALAHSDFLQDVLALMDQGVDVLEGRIASPIQVSTEVMFPADGSYGSQMSPFYTMLAQWVGALFNVVLLKTRLRPEDRPKKLKMHQHYLGRLVLFLAVGLCQALITSVGDVLYVGICCEHPWLFILAAVVSGLCFTMINYMLAFTLGAAGLAVSVIVMVIQVAGAGGTYPVEVVPPIFQALYPYMPFKFGMNAMREAVSGLYGTYYWENLGVLAATALATVPLGFLIYRPGKWLNDLLEKAKRASEIMT